MTSRGQFICRKTKLPIKSGLWIQTFPWNLWVLKWYIYYTISIIVSAYYILFYGSWPIQLLDCLYFDVRQGNNIQKSKLRRHSHLPYRFLLSLFVYHFYFIISLVELKRKQFLRWKEAWVQYLCTKIPIGGYLMETMCVCNVWSLKKRANMLVLNLRNKCKFKIAFWMY